jgi:hypothetical protein
MKMLKEKDLEVDIDEKDEDGYTPLAEAARLGFTAGVVYLLGFSGDLVDPNAIDVRGNTPLMHATLGKHWTCVEILAHDRYVASRRVELEFAREKAALCGKHRVMPFLDDLISKCPSSSLLFSVANHQYCY